MRSSISNLIIRLTENESILNTLSESLQAEQRYILDHDLEQLSHSCQRKESITAQLDKVNGECRILMHEASSQLGLTEVPTLSKLIAVAAASEQSELKPVQLRLQRISARLERQHAFNRRLLERSIDTVKNSMNHFNRLLGGCDTYGSKGRINTNIASGNILRQEI